jgi:hypothetical protein
MVVVVSVDATDFARRVTALGLLYAGKILEESVQYCFFFYAKIVLQLGAKES